MFFTNHLAKVAKVASVDLKRRLITLVQQLNDDAQEDDTMLQPEVSMMKMVILAKPLKSKFQKHTKDIRHRL